MKILFVVCTKQNTDGFYKSRIYRSLARYHPMTCTGCTEQVTDEGYTELFIRQPLKDLKFDVLANCDHTVSFTKTYNKCLRYAADKKYDTIIFVHDDVSLEDTFFFDKLEAALKEYSIVGLAGATQAKLKQPALWHLMSEQEHWRGCVCHRFVQGDEERFVWSHYGPSPSRVLLLDGLFLACRVKDLIDYEVGFNESIPHNGYHHYDMLFSLSANKAGLKLGTYPIWAVHDSGGLEEKTQAYHDSEQYFLKAASSLL